MSDGLIRKIFEAGMMTASIGSLSMIVAGVISYPVSKILHNDSILEKGMYLGLGIGIISGVVLSYITYRDY